MTTLNFLKTFVPSKIDLGEELVYAEKKFADEDGVSRTVVAGHSHGNIRLQNGEFFIKSDVDATFEKIRNVRFSGA